MAWITRVNTVFLFALKYQYVVSKWSLLQHQNKINWQKRSKESVGSAPRFHQYCQTPGQKFPQYFDVHVTFFRCLSKFKSHLFTSQFLTAPLTTFWGTLAVKHFLSLSSSTVKAYMEMLYIPSTFFVKVFSFERNNGLWLARRASCNWLLIHPPY